MIRIHHMVKWLDGQLRYGLAVPPLLGEAQSLARDGKVLIDDALLPGTQWVLLEGDISDVGPDEYQCYIQQSFQIAKRESDTLGRSVVKGKLLFRHVPRRSAACYVIVGVTKQLCKVEWRGFSGDRITYPAWGYSHIVATSTCERLVDEETAMRLYGTADLIADSNNEQEQADDM